MTVPLIYHYVKNVQNKIFFWIFFPVFGLNTEIYYENLRIQAECGNGQTRKNSEFEHFPRSIFQKSLLQMLCYTPMILYASLLFFCIFSVQCFYKKLSLYIQLQSYVILIDGSINITSTNIVENQSDMLRRVFNKAFLKYAV